MKKGQYRYIVKIGISIITMLCYCLSDVNVFANDIKSKDKVLSTLRIENRDSKKNTNIDTERCVANIFVDAYRIKLNNKIVGYVNNKDVGNLILKNLEEKYLNRININKNNIQDIKISTNLNFEKQSVKCGDIMSIDEMSDNIIKINETIEEPELKVEVIAINKSLDDIKPTTKFIENNELYIGQSKVKEGISGKKEIIKKDKYINGKYIENKIMEEKTLVEPKEEIIYTGTKDPIPERIKFLKHPTNGGVITSKFGYRKGGTHSGIDIGVPNGTPISASCNGVVIYVGYDSIYGNMIVLRHSDNLETLYAHASEINVKVGDEVKSGEVIAKSGNTGRSTGPHLHFGLKYNGVAIDPNNFIE